jgi:hypothetical protein
MIVGGWGRRKEKTTHTKQNKKHKCGGEKEVESVRGIKKK